MIEVAGDSARFAWEEFFYAKIRSEHTRRAYMRAVRYFMRWCEAQSLELGRISPAHVGLYLDNLQVSICSKKQVLAGLRHFFDGMVTLHAIALNPALSVRTERYSVLEGKTPEITVKHARGLMQSIDTSNIIGLRDKCIIAILIYTAARIGAVSKLKVKDLYDAGDQFCLHFIDNQKDAVRAPCAGLVDLVGIDDEILAQHRDRARGARGQQVLRRAAEELSIGED